MKLPRFTTTLRLTLLFAMTITCAEGNDQQAPVRTAVTYQEVQKTHTWTLSTANYERILKRKLWLKSNARERRRAREAREQLREIDNMVGGIHVMLHDMKQMIAGINHVSTRQLKDLRKTLQDVNNMLREQSRDVGRQLDGVNDQVQIIDEVNAMLIDVKREIQVREDDETH